MSVFPLTLILIVTYASRLVLRGLKISQTEHRGTQSQRWLYIRQTDRHISARLLKNDKCTDWLSADMPQSGGCWHLSNTLHCRVTFKQCFSFIADHLSNSIMNWQVANPGKFDIPFRVICLLVVKSPTQSLYSGARMLWWGLHVLLEKSRPIVPKATSIHTPPPHASLAPSHRISVTELHST